MLIFMYVGGIYCSKCVVPSVSFCVLSVGFPFVLSHTLRTSLGDACGKSCQNMF